MGSASAGSGVLVGRVWCYPVKNGGRVWVERRRRTSSEGGWVWCRPPPAMPPPRAALSGPSPHSRREESRSGGRLLLLRHIEDVLRTKKEKETGLWSAPLSGMHTHVPREKERGRRQAGSACACSGFIWPNFRM